MSIQQHPHYHEGFFGALAGDPLFDDHTPEYKAGWEAAWRSKEIFEAAGFKQTAQIFQAHAALTARRSPQVSVQPEGE